MLRVTFVAGGIRNLIHVKTAAKATCNEFMHANLSIYLPIYHFFTFIVLNSVYYQLPTRVL